MIGRKYFNERERERLALRNQYAQYAFLHVLVVDGVVLLFRTLTAAG